MWMTIASFLIGPIGRWILISLASVFFLGWIRADARAPYEKTVTELKTAIKNRDANAERDRVLAESNAARAEELEHALDKIILASGQTACRLSPAELASLRGLSGTGSR